MLGGIWAIKDQGRLIEVVRLEQDGDGYLLSEKHQDRWVNRRPAVAVGRERLEAFLREPISAPFIALGHDRFVVVKTEPGWSAGRFRTEIGYWLISPIGPLELHKR